MLRGSMSDILEKIYRVIVFINVMILIGGTYLVISSALNHVSNILFKNGFNTICTILYVASCVHCYLVYRNDKRDKDRWHQGWVGRRLKRVSIKIEKNGKVVLDTSKKFSYIDEMRFYDESELVCYLLGDD